MSPFTNTSTALGGRSFDYVGAGRHNVNIPLNKVGNGDGDYLAAFLRVIMPLLHEFEPELILVSAGYDPALGCIEGEQEVTPACFAHMTHLLKSLKSSKIVALMCRPWQKGLH